MTFPSRNYVHQASVSTRLAETATGSELATPVSVRCFINDARRLMVTATGEQLASNTLLYADPKYVGLFTPDTEVTSAEFNDGRIARVIRVNAMSPGALPVRGMLEVELL